MALSLRGPLVIRSRGHQTAAVAKSRLEHTRCRHALGASIDRLSGCLQVLREIRHQSSPQHIEVAFFAFQIPSDNQWVGAMFQVGLR